MATIESSTTFGRDICNALGIDPLQTRRIVIDINSRSVAVVYVEQHIDKGSKEGLCKAIAKARKGDGLKIVRVESLDTKLSLEAST